MRPSAGSVRWLWAGKNYLFCGSDAGGQRAACIYTIIETAKLNGINPEAYLADVLARIADHPSRDIDALLPWRWAPLPAAAPTVTAANG